jgi:hypothetical protein
MTHNSRNREAKVVASAQQQQQPKIQNSSVKGEADTKVPSWGRRTTSLLQMQPLIAQQISMRFIIK